MKKLISLSLLISFLLLIPSCSQKTVEITGKLNAKIINENTLKVELESNTMEGTNFGILISNDANDARFAELVNPPFSKTYKLTEWPTSNVTIQAVMSLSEDFTQPDKVKKLYGKNGKNMIGKRVANYADGSGKNLLLETSLNYENNLPPLKYELITDYWGDVSFGPVIRLAYNVIVPKGSDEHYVTRVAAEIIESVIENQDINAIALYFYDDKDEEVYNVAKIDWAPYGKWSRAKEVSVGDYRYHDFDIYYKK